MDSSPPNTLLVELDGSPSDSLSSESFNVTTTDLCFGSCGEEQKFLYQEKVKRRLITYSLEEKMMLKSFVSMAQHDTPVPHCMKKLCASPLAPIPDTVT